MPAVSKAVRILDDKVDDTLPLMVAIVSPFEFTVRSRSIERVIEDILMKPELLRRVLDFAVKVETEYGKALLDAGAQALFLIDGSLQVEVFGRQLYEKFPMSYVKDVIAKLGRPTILQICGNSTKIEEMTETGATALSVDHAVNIDKAKSMVKRLELLAMWTEQGTSSWKSPKRLGRILIKKLP